MSVSISSGVIGDKKYNSLGVVEDQSTFNL